MPKSKPKKRGPKAMKDKAKLPRRASMNAKIQHALNSKKRNTTMNVYRHGMTLMWRVAKKELRAGKIKKIGNYDPMNAHGGKIWGWPNEMNLTNAKVKRIMFACISCYKLTIDQLRTVRKSLAYAWQLYSHKTADQEEDDNWPCMRRLFTTIDYKKLPKKIRTTLPERVPTVDELKVAFTKPWTPAHPFCFSKFCQAVPAAYDTFIWGCRSFEDHQRIKRSRNHVIRPSEGYISTEYVDGRCKSPIVPRAWSRYVVCLCPGGCHKSPSPFFKSTLDKNGNPTKGIDWFCTCPVACLEFMWSYDDAVGRSYAKCQSKGRFGKQEEGDIPKLAVDWMIAQGVCTEEDRFSHNSGRKALARWCSKYHIEYKDSFQIHQDLHKTWKKRYQHDLLPSTFKDRDQSKSADTCCVALRALAMNWKLGPKKKPALTKEGRLLYHVLKKSDPSLADAIRYGLDSDEDNSDVPPKVEVDAPVAPSAIIPHKKRKRAVVKPEPEDPEFQLRPPPAKRPKKSAKKKKQTPKKKPRAVVKPEHEDPEFEISQMQLLPVKRAKKKKKSVKKKKQSLKKKRKQKRKKKD